jgi:hypothetical protein
LAEHSKIADVAPRIQHTATGSQTHFDYTFPIFDDAGLEVYLDDVRQTSGFEVHDAGNSSGDTLTFESPPASGALVTLYRQILIERTIDFLREWKIGFPYLARPPQGPARGPRPHLLVVWRPACPDTGALFCAPPKGT